MKEIRFTGSINTAITIPGSKYIANRVLPIASLARGQSIIRNIPHNNDIKHAIQAFRDLGIGIEVKESRMEIKGSEGGLKIHNNEIDTGESGTLMRFITAVTTLAEGQVRITGSDRIKERPVGELVDSLIELGAEIERENGECPPILIKSSSLKGGKTKIDGGKSSQFISALLLIGSYAENDVEIEVLGKKVSSSYIDLTVNLIREFGVKVEKISEKEYKIKTGQYYQARDYTIPADWSTANFFFAAAALTGGQVSISNLDINSLQGEANFVYVLEKMGCELSWKKEKVTLKAPKNLRGVDVNMGSIPDAVPALSAVAAFCDEEVRIRNIAHLRYKECDRIQAIVEELSKIDVKVVAREDELIIQGGSVNKQPVVFNSHNDHRIAMSMALIGLRIPGIKVSNPESVNKSFPGFWSKLKSIGVQVKDVG